MDPLAKAALVLTLGAACLNFFAAVTSFLEKNVLTTRTGQPALSKKP